MTSLSQALYSSLLLDLQPYCSASVFEAVQTGKVDTFPGCTVRDIAIMQLGSSFLKKLKDETSSEADAMAYTKFISANSRCETWSLQVESLLDEVLVSNFRKVVDKFFYRGANSFISDDLVTLITESDLVGPGAAVGALGNDFYTKLFAGPLTCTSQGLYLAYRASLSSVQDSWIIGDDLRSSKFGNYSLVRGNRLTFVPKTHDCSRSICIEPVLNMLVQKGLGNAIARRTRQYFGIDLSCQQLKNRELARLGSVNGCYSTIDLASASDTIALKMLEEFLPQHVLSCIKLLRSPECFVSKTGEWIKLHMVSTMGNGFTFPLQTMLFACVVKACAEVVEMPLEPPRGESLGTYGVNGDDIVVPSGITMLVIRLLNILGFEVNKLKSFHEGHFRESCGGDYFRGHPVRGVYLKTLLDQSSRYSAINLLNRWSARHNIPLRRTVRVLLRTVEDLRVPPWEDLSAGIHVPYSMVKKLRRCKHTKSIIYRRNVFAPVKLTIREGDICVPNREEERIYNPEGLLISFLHGGVRGTTSNGGVGAITIRHDSGRFRKRTGIAPNWDNTYTIREPIPDKGRWESAVWINLS